MPDNIKIISESNASGSVCLKNDDAVKIRLKLTLAKPLEETDVLKIMLASSADTTVEPIYCGLAQTDGTDCIFSKTVDSIGDRADKLDTVNIFCKNVFTEETSPFISVCFSDKKEISKDDYEILPELEKVREQLDLLQNDSAYKAFLSVSENIKSPMERAADALEALYNLRSSPCEEGMHKKCINDVEQTACKYEKVCLGTAEDFQWYRITDSDMPYCASAFEHVLSYPTVNASILTFAHYLLGIRKSSDTVCIAIPVQKNAPNPMSHLDDCTVYIKVADLEYEYCTVCISFEPDGQYFMPIC